jgi:hypothetical protein
MGHAASRAALLPPGRAAVVRPHTHRSAPIRAENWQAGAESVTANGPKPIGLAVVLVDGHPSYHNDLKWFYFADTLSKYSALNTSG